jgi:hypothetical protein
MAAELEEHEREQPHGGSVTCCLNRGEAPNVFSERRLQALKYSVVASVQLTQGQNKEWLVSWRSA